MFENDWRKNFALLKTRCIFGYILLITNTVFLFIDLEKEIDNSDLQAMFEATFRHDARQRLQHDGDYTPQQFPNSEEYYMKEQK